MLKQVSAALSQFSDYPELMKDAPVRRSGSPLPLILVSVVIVVFAFLLLTRGGAGDTEEPLVLATLEPTATLAPPTATPAPVANSPEAPTAGRWIDVDLTKFEVQLMQGNSVLRTIGPVAVGEQIDTGIYESTATGLYYVYAMTEELTYDAPYDTYISHWIGFDPELHNGFHSLLKDAAGNVVDPSTGRVSNGCIRVDDVEAIFEFAEIGMPVLVHT